jgi:hypothetical protein
MGEVNRYFSPEFKINAVSLFGYKCYKLKLAMV